MQTVEELISILENEKILGLPKEWFVEPVNQIPTCFGNVVDPKVVFIAGSFSIAEKQSQAIFIGDEAELLQSAIEKGLSITINEISYYVILDSFDENIKNKQLDAISAIKPKAIVTLGREAKNLLSADSSQEIFIWRNIKVIPTIDLKSVIADPVNKRVLWNSLQLVISELNQV